MLQGPRVIDPLHYNIRKGTNPSRMTRLQIMGANGMLMGCRSISYLYNVSACLEKMKLSVKLSILAIKRRHPSTKSHLKVFGIIKRYLPVYWVDALLN